jgi:hypothetical protein
VVGKVIVAKAIGINILYIGIIRFVINGKPFATNGGIASSNLDDWICTKGNHKFHIP